ncbi:GNAT family N-acetyltransferase [Williamwhitmania taraxaci]|uniref:Acetyltransferase (GNAT) domain-containing protein n=1 Tax=Williamwhitmania taraxaci TaxID=1640674 RepID=A0A1G6GGL7_9BACT|nr:GNAT family N-acetyltransferase [Williamwhitmania taraxaci]SDB81158.1 Acetyltransferase (GNAT) domain-containing protein [Williamwhitmania taraxaci]
MVNFEIINLSDSVKWNKYLHRLPQKLQDIYFTPEYYRLYEERGEGLAQCYVFEDGSGLALYPFLKNNVNSLGYSLDKEYFDIQGAYGYNGVICNTNNFDFIDKFNKSFQNYCRAENIITEFTRFHPIIENQRFAVNHLQILFDRETIAIDLTQSYDEIWFKEYSSKNRNMIRKAEKLGYTSKIITQPSRNEINNFISIYQRNMEMVGAEDYYYFNKEFFYNIFSLQKGFVYLFNIEDCNRQVASSTIFFYYGDFFHYHLSGRAPSADNSVNNFLLNEAVKFAKDMGAKTFHLGGGRSCAPDDSLLKFKSNFSKTYLPFYIGKRLHNHDVYDEVVRQWEARFPEKSEKYKNHVLKYRY